jgi:hypothetical protein
LVAHPSPGREVGQQVAKGNRIWNCERLIETLARRGCDGFYPSG